MAAGPLTRIAANGIDIAPSVPLPDNDPTGNAPVSVMTSFEFWLSAILLLFGFVVIATQLYMVVRRQDADARTVPLETALRLSIVSLIIVGALVLIASGYSDKQIGPAMGLFGTVAGYLVGRQDRNDGGR